MSQVAKTNAPHHAQYESAIRTFEAHDATNPPSKNALLFVGSSSIRLWTNAPAQFPQYPIINRGFGGSYLTDVVAFADRIIVPYRPRLIVLFAGENDIAGGRSADSVITAFKELAGRVRAKLPDTPIIFLAIKPSPSREKFHPEFQAANTAIGAFMAGQKHLRYVDVATPLRDASGKVRLELFRPDRLHLNERGYEVWAETLRPALQELAPGRPR